MNRRTVARAVWPLVALACLALAACSGSDAAAPRDISPDDLAGMILQPDTLQISGVNLLVDPAETKLDRRDEVLAASFNPAEDGNDMRNFGWQAGYHKVYLRQDGEAPIAYVTIDVSLYATPSGAVRDLVDDFEEAPSFVGKTSFEGTQLLSASPWVVASIDGARGLLISVLKNNSPYWVTIVKFQRGNVVGGVSVASYDGATDLRIAAETLAVQLANQITTVITGVSPTPIPTPVPTPTPVASETPAPAPQ